MTGPTVHLVAPATVGDPARPSGGNVYDRRLALELEHLGLDVRMHAAPGHWPTPDAADLDALAATLAALAADDIVLADGLVASAAPTVVARAAESLRVVVLVHQPLGLVSAERRDAEAAMLRSVAAVVTTSAWTRHWLLAEYDVPRERVVVAVPGADLAPLATGTADGGALLCVGAVTPGKGQDVLVEALGTLASRSWHCTVVGSLDVDPEFAHGIDSQVRGSVPGRVDLVGPLLGDDLDAAYLAADVLVLPSRAETYGMVVTEALAHGLPVIASATGGTLEALGHTPAGRVPGLTASPGDATALAGALRRWLDDPGLRTELRAAAGERRPALPAWRRTALEVAEALRG